MSLIPRPASLQTGFIRGLTSVGLAVAAAIEKRDYAVGLLASIYRLPPDVVARGLDAEPGLLLAVAAAEDPILDRVAITRAAYTAFGSHPQAVAAISQAAGYTDRAP